MTVDHACVLLKEIVIGLHLPAMLVSSPLEGSHVDIDLSGLTATQAEELGIVLTHYKVQQDGDKLVVG